MFKSRGLLMNSLKYITIIFIVFGYLNPLFSQETEKQDTTKKISYAGIPVVNYNRSVGYFFGAMGAMYYKVNKTDTISPSSSTMIWGGITTNSTYAIGGNQQLYLNEDKWRISFMAAHGNFVYQYFLEFPTYGQYNDNGQWIDYTSKGEFVRLDVRRRAFKNLYIGAVLYGNWLTTEFDMIDPETGNNMISKADMISVGYTLSYDGRDDVNFPTKGFLVNFENRFVREGLGSSNNYDKLKTSLNYFWDIKKNAKTVLVSRFFTDLASGDVPFQAQSSIGQDDLRGYSEGKYRGDQIYAVQAEIRQNVYKKFGMVGFLGIGSAVDNISEIPDSEILPSIGLGVRYMAITKEKINIGIDVGLGKDDWSLTFRIGETFGR